MKLLACMLPRMMEERTSPLTHTRVPEGQAVSHPNELGMECHGHECKSLLKTDRGWCLIYYDTGPSLHALAVMPHDGEQLGTEGAGEGRRPVPLSWRS